MHRVLKLAAAVELLLVIAEGAIPQLRQWLPIGGSHLAQIGFCFGLAFVVTEFVASVSRPKNEPP